MSQEQKTNYNKNIKPKKQMVEELELNARYWKANYELKYYTLLDSEIGTKYFELLEKLKASGDLPSEDKGNVIKMEVVNPQTEETDVQS